MYINRISFGGNVAIVENYHTYRCNSESRTRRPNANKTTAQQAAINARNSAMNTCLIALENFKKGDYWIRLSYFEGERPESIEAAHNNLRKLLKKLKRKCKELYYIGNTEEGTHGGLHHHLLIPSWYDINNIINEWYGGVYCKKTYSGELSQLASYLTKGELDGQLPENERNTQQHKRIRKNMITKSANLKRPRKPIIRKVRADHWRKDISSKKINGDRYILKPGTVITGFTADGYPYQRCIMIKQE